MATEVFAPAKVNLTLHVTGRRANGYHLLDSLVVFADIGDTVAAEPSDNLSLAVRGPMGAGVPTDSSNLVLQAARFLDAGRGARLTLTKRLPASSGIGGGSSDAAACLHALSLLWGVALPEDVLALGADVPVCMSHTPQRLQGVGETLSPVKGLPDCEILLVNPGVAVSTPEVFAAMTRRDNPPMGEMPRWPTAQALAGWLGAQRNDMQAAAITLQPVIALVLGALSGTNCLYHGMSGSGATCFALFPPGNGAAKAAEEQVRAARPEWWSAAGRLL